MSQASISNTTDASTGYPRGGGVSLSTTASSAKGTIFGGSAAGSHMSSSIGGTPSSRQSISSTAGAASVASSSAASTTSTHRPGNFYKKSYGTSGHPSPTGSTTTNNREFAKVSSVCVPTFSFCLHSEMTNILQSGPQEGRVGHGSPSARA